VTYAMLNSDQHVDVSLRDSVFVPKPVIPIFGWLMETKAGGSYARSPEKETG
jgi:hypothetical protein